MSFTKNTFPVYIDDVKIEMFNKVWERMAEPGYWWNATEKQAIIEVIRSAKPREIFNRQRESVDVLAAQPSAGILSPLVIDTIERIVTESGQLTKEWAQKVIAKMGEGAYAELIGVTILVLPIDLFCMYLGVEKQPLLPPKSGEASRELPPNLVHNNAWIRQTQEAIDNKELVNVSRAISILPIENTLRRDLVDAMYMEKHSFFDKVWENKALTRPQLEIVATKTSAINECFYCATGHSAIFNMTAKKVGYAGKLDFLKEGDNSSDIPHSDLLLEVTESANRTPEEVVKYHDQLIDVFTTKGMVEIFAVIAIFNGLNRTSDPSGVALEEVLVAAMGSKIDQFGLANYQGVNRVKRPNLWQRIMILLAFKWRRMTKSSGQ